MNKLMAIVSLFVLAGCQTPMQTGSHCVVAPGFIPKGSAVTWRSDVPIDSNDATGYISPLNLQSIENAVTSELNGKELNFVPRPNADQMQHWNGIEIAVTLRTRRELVSFENSGTLCETSDCWERVDMGSQTRMDLRTIGFLAADAYYDGEPIWRGWVETNLFPSDRDAAADVIERAIPVLFKSFPP